MSNSGICPVCDVYHAELQSHHIAPLHLGGAVDGPQILICGVCHINIHRESSALLAKKPSKKQYLTNAQLLKPIVKELISTIVRLTLSFNKSENPLVMRKIIVEVEDGLLKMMHKRKMDLGFTNMESYIKSLLISDVRKL